MLIHGFEVALGIVVVAIREEKKKRKNWWKAGGYTYFIQTQFTIPFQSYFLISWVDVLSECI